MRTKEELDRLRERAIALRREGKSRREIQAILGLVSRSTLNQLLQGVPPPRHGGSALSAKSASPVS
jgi:transposase